MTQRARRRRNGRARGSVAKKALLGLGVLLAIGLIAAAAGAAWVWSKYESAPALADLKPIKKGRSSAVYAADGSLLGFIHSDNISQPVSQGDLPDDLKQATVAIEDKNYYEHGGIDPAAIIRAGWEDLLAGGKPVQGGSTITQQLVRNLYIANPQETVERKIIEAHLANDLEDERSKDWILAKYLNSAPYGTNGGSTAIGAQAAAETYFDKPARDLTLTEAAMLAGLPQAPSEYNPFLDPHAALTRRNDVLEAMQQQGYISPSEYADAAGQDLGLEHGYKYQTVKQRLIFDFVQQELFDKYGVNTVRNGGLKVYTTIQPRLQAAAQEAVDTACSVCTSDPAGPKSALASVDPTNGQILALASSSSYAQANQFNLAWQAHRQPGSSFKAFVLTTAIKQGIDPETTYYSGASPKTLRLDKYSTWTVNNAEPGGGTENLVSATINSVNVIFAQLGLDVGPTNFAQTAYDMGITSPLGVDSSGASCHSGSSCYVPAADAIGGINEGVTPLEMADAYATLANGGVHHDATAIGKVVFPNGDVDEPATDEGNRVLTPGEAYEVTKILEQVITSGTGTPASIGCSTGSAGKTGTSEELSDAWFVGYTPKFSTAVWTGHPNSREFTGYGGPTSGPIWQQYMTAATGGACTPFPVPTDLPSLSTYTSDHTVSPHVKTYPSSPAPTPDTSSGQNGSGKYPGQFYAPGAGQGPAPSPTPGGGNPGGGNGGGGGTGGTG
jgi:penicillin-binding protein 1A